MKKYTYAILLLFLSVFFQNTVQAQPIQVPRELYGDPNSNNRENKRKHRGHYPFISHLTFRNICDIVIDDFVESFDPNAVKCGDTIYLNIWYLDWFVKNVHDRIRHPYILVTCDVGDFLPNAASMKLLYDPKCAAWFGRNMIFSYHPKLIQIPMGQDLALFWLERGPEVLVQACAKKASISKKHLLYMNHFPRPWGDREKIITLFENAPYCLSHNHSGKKYMPVGLAHYYDDLLSSQFVLSPLGLETDCVRTWEALALGCIPILEHTFLDPLFENLPVVLVNQWEEIDEQFLKEKYEKLKNLPVSERVYFDYWHEQIKETQTRIRKQDLRTADLDALLFQAGDLSGLNDILEDYATKHHDRVNLFFRGSLSAMRAMQLAHEMPFISKFCLHDVWLNGGIWSDLEYLMTNYPLISMKNKIVLIDTEELFRFVLDYFNEEGTVVFLDLTYYRHSLYWDLNNHDRLRHSLKRDILQLCSPLDPGVLVCGNMRCNDYVSEVLEQLSHDNALPIQTRGNFWFFVVPE